MSVTFVRNSMNIRERLGLFLVFATVAIFAPCVCDAQDAVQVLPSFETATKTIQSSTVTIRITCDANVPASETSLSTDSDQTSLSRSDPSPASADEKTSPDANDHPETKTATQKQVLVFSGVCIDEGKIVTPLFLAPTRDIRITLPGGQQCLGRTLVMDEYSGLSLLDTDIDSDTLGRIEIVDEHPAVGSFVLSGSGWGVNQPLVSFGIVSGFDHHLPNSNLPGLMACDVRTARTSKGAPIVDTRGRLRGIVIAMATGQDGGWTYAIPAKHIARLTRAYNENFIDKDTGEEKKDVGVLVLPRKRPKIGFRLHNFDGKIKVERVDKKGPAELAGIREGDEILRVEGLEIRSLYQLIRPTLARQPGDLLRLTVRNTEGIVEDREVLLGGGSTFKAAELNEIGKFIIPQIVVSRSAEPEIELVFPKSAALTQSAGDTTAAQRDPQRLETVMHVYRQAYEKQKSRLDETRQRLAEFQKQTAIDRQEIEELQIQIKSLKDANK